MINMKFENMKKISVKNLILLLVGGILILVCISGRKVPDTEEVTTQVYENTENSDMAENEVKISDEERLAQVLSKADGIGQTEVMIIYRSSEEELPMQDEKGNILVSRQQNNMPFIRKTYSAEIEGILVVAEGADRTEVVQNVSDAVEALFGIPKHKIIVLPMKK